MLPERSLLWPFAQAELARRPLRIVEQLLGKSSPEIDAAAVGKEELADRLLGGGFPEAVSREDDRREQWLASYLSVLVQHDLRDLANLERLSQVPAILASLAGRVRVPLNKTSLGSAAEVSRTTLDRYLTLLEHVFLTRSVPACHTNKVRQLTKAPKVLIADSAVLCYLLRASRERLCEEESTLGIALECFAGMELAKQTEASSLSAELLHMRTATGSEIDFLLEGRDRTVACIEVKASATVRGEDFKHLQRARDRLGERFARGVVFYLGGERLSFGERLEAWPLSSLWA